ncbi:MAG TPA: LytTR family transcriptional regulator DNA-binding domain-containing protein [Patescibacteria group bacterium]|nr:LytTR family transcriptional regulator DNA-binding domain-containing protein [Patescibacteria group bacterium]
MSNPPATASFEYRLQREPVGVVVLDSERRVVSANPIAAALLSRSGMDWRGADIVSLHPAAAQSKVRWLLDTAQAAPDQPAGMTMTLPTGTLVTRVTALSGSGSAGYCMLFHTIDRPATAPVPTPDTSWLVKLPLSVRSGLALIDVNEVVYLRADGHYTRAVSEAADALCTLPLTELERRLDPAQFLRVHRSYLVNLRHTHAVERSDGQWWLIMATEAPTRVPVSRANIEGLRHRLGI